MPHSLVLDRYLAPVPDGQPFPHRVHHPWMARRPTPMADPDGRYAALLEGGGGSRLAYVHVPFCANHCLFCGFYRNRTDAAAMRRYVDHLVREIARDAARPGIAAHPVEAVFLGGGTPSALSADDLHRVLSALREHLPLAADCEVTVEGRVAGFDAEKVEACLDAGANRFSIGIQSFDTRLRRRMGRKAAREEAAAFLSDLAARDRAAVICDLIYGLPGQTDEIWREDVETCDRLGLDGVDLYCLSLQPDSPLALSIAKGSLPPAGDEAGNLKRYREGCAVLARAGWTRLSQAHWGRTPRERNRYNRFTKRGADCLAFGAGAGGMLDGHRFMNEGDVSAYEARVAADEKPIAAMLAPAPHHAARGSVMDALEAGALDFGALDAAVEEGFSSALRPLFADWARKDLVAPDAAGLTLTVAGRYWYNNLAATLFELTDAYLDGAAAPPMPPHGVPQMRHPGARHPSFTSRSGDPAHARHP